MNLFNIIAYWPQAIAGLSLIIGYYLLFDKYYLIRYFLSSILFIIIGLILYGTLGSPRPIFISFERVDGELLGYQIKEKENIFLYISERGIKAPQSISIPFSEKFAANLESAEDKAQKDGDRIFIHLGPRDKSKPGETQGSGKNGGGNGKNGENTDSLAANIEGLQLSVRLKTHEPIQDKAPPSQ